MEFVDMIWELRVFWIAMIILDGIIAFLVPAWKVEKKLKNPKTANMISRLYGKRIFKAVQPQLRKETDHFINSLETKLTTTLNSNLENVNKEIEIKINNLCTNHIPSILDTKMKDLQIYVKDMESSLKSDIWKVMSMGGHQAKNEKNAKRSYIENAILTNNPKMSVFMDLAKDNLTKKEYDQALMLMGMFKPPGGQVPGISEEMSTRQPLPQDTQSFPEMRQEEWKEASLEAVKVNQQKLSKEEKNFLVSQFEGSGIPEKQIRQAIAIGESKNAQKLKVNENQKEEKENGKEKEKEKRET